MYGQVAYLGPIFNTVGLALDIVGVWVLSYGVIISKKTARELAATKWNVNEELQEALLKQSSDARRGLCIIIPGFGLQILGSWLSTLT